MSSPSSLRDLYAPPPDAWSFAPPTANGTQQAASPQGPTYQWSAHPGSKHSLGLSGAVPEGVDFKAFARGVVTAVLAQYATSAVAVPWEVGKTLLQVQWVPRDVEARLVAEDEHEEDQPLSEETSEEEPSYFAEPTIAENDSEEGHAPPPRTTDERGYIIRQSIADDEITPEYVIPVGSASGTWGMMHRVRSFRPEGWLSLWKGLFTTTATELLNVNLQPVIGSLLESLLSPPTDSSFTPTPIFIPIATQVVTGFLLSPLDLIRTRLIVQSSVERHKTYNGPFDALKQILEQEGGLRGIYFHPQLFWPTIVDCTLRGVVPWALSSFMASYLAISPETHPFTLSCVELLANFTGLLVTTPFETIRKRLQVQVRGTAKPLKACVELRPVPYVGMIDAFWHIVTEERSDLPLKPKRRRRKSVDGKVKAEEEPEEAQQESWLKNTGIGQLYRGLGLRVGASLTVFILALTTGKDEADAGWAEL